MPSSRSQETVRKVLGWADAAAMKTGDSEIIGADKFELQGQRTDTQRGETMRYVTSHPSRLGSSGYGGHPALSVSNGVDMNMMPRWLQ